MRATEESGEGLGLGSCVCTPVLQVCDVNGEAQGLLHTVRTTCLTPLEKSMSGHFPTMSGEAEVKQLV